MSAYAKTDYFGLDGDGLKIDESTENKSASVATANDSTGSVIASNVTDEHMSPSCNYVITGAVTKSLVIGSVTDDVMLGSVTINTTSGGQPTFSASGEQVEAGAATGCKYTISLADLSPKWHAQTLFSMFTVGGTGCHLTAANYTVGGTVGRSVASGECVASDVYAGLITAQITITQSGTEKPTLTAGTGCDITAPLTCTTSGGEFPTWTATITKYITKDA